MNRMATILLLMAATGFAGPAWAQYPDRPVRIIVPYAAGGGIDTAARNVANGLAQTLGKPVIVENRPGANSVIGANAVVTSPPDGYTLLFTSGATVSVLPHIAKSLPFDPARDLIPVGKVGRLPFFLVVNTAMPAKDLTQYIAQAKAAPGTITYASAGSGTGSHLGFELLKQAAGIDVTHVPYKATNEALPDLLTGRVTSMMADLATLQRSLASGSLRVLAVTSKDRSTALLAVPTVAEQGVPGFDLQLWYALFAPAGTPAAVVSRLNSDLRAFLQTPAAASAAANGGYTLDPTTPQELGALVAAESVRWANLARTGALKID